MPDDWGQRLLDLVDQALTVEPSGRDSWLDEACGGDERLRQEVAALLTFDDEGEDLLQVEQDTSDVRLASSSHSIPTLELGDTLPPGSQIGDYLIEDCLGAGGMGVVYLATQLSLNRRVALKIMPASLASMPTARARFQREVESAARLHHDNIVAVHTTGDDGAISYYAMEWIDGPPLSQVIAHLRRHPIAELISSTALLDTRKASKTESAGIPKWVAGLLSPQASSAAEVESNETSPDLARLGRNFFDVVATMLAGVADGLEYAHQNRVVHRDIKPSNLLLAEDGRLHISDFGLARMIAEPGVTQSGEFVGTPFYMAPEQINSNLGEVDGRTDVYALGTTLYELLTLRPPIPGETRDEVLARIVRQEPVPPRRVNRRIPRELETICLKAIEKEPGRRYQSAAALASDLRRYVGRLPIAAQRGGMVGRTAKWCRRHPSVAASLALAVCLASVASILAYRAHHAHEQRAITAERASRIEEELQSTQAAIDQAKQERIFQDALLAAMQGDQETVAASVQEAERIGASAGRLHILRGQIAIFGADFEDALSELTAAVELMPDNLAAHALLAESYARIGHWGTSTEWLDRVRGMEPDSIEDLILKGRMELHHDAEAAEATLDQAIARDRRNIVARLIRGAIRAERAYGTCEPSHAESALEDLQLASTLLDETPYLLSQFLTAHLTAAAAYEATGEEVAKQRHLDSAMTFANRLADYDRDYEAHRWRAYYFERIGDLDQAVVEWQAIEEKTIGFLIMALYRTGRFDDALEACDRYGETATTGTAEFCHAFVLAAVCPSAEELIADFPFGQRFARLSKDAELRRAHILWCLAGMPERAIEDVRRIEVDDETLRKGAQRYEYVTGNISDVEFLQQTEFSRYEQARAHFVIGLRRLAHGERDAARQHFENSVSYRFDFNFFTAMSRALLTQMERAPTWPPWIGSSDGDVIETVGRNE